MRLPRVRFTIGRLMIVIVVVALVLTPLVWFLRLPVEVRRALLVGIPLAIIVFSLFWSPIIVEGIRNYRRIRAFNTRTPRNDMNENLEMQE